MSADWSVEMNEFDIAECDSLDEALALMTTPERETVVKQLNDDGLWWNE